MKNDNHTHQEIITLFNILNTDNEETVNCKQIKQYFEYHNLEKNILYKIVNDISLIKSSFDLNFFSEFINMNYNSLNLCNDEKRSVIINQFQFLILEFGQNNDNVNNTNNSVKNSDEIKKLKEKDKEKNIEIDVLNNENCITKDILEKLLFYDKNLIKDSKFDLLLKYVDIVKDNKINYYEFEKIMMGKVKTLKNLEDMASLKV